MDDDRQAISALNKAIELYPTSFLNLVVIGQMLDAEGHRELAQRVYRQAVHNSGAYLQLQLNINKSQLIQFLQDQLNLSVGRPK